MNYMERVNNVKQYIFKKRPIIVINLYVKHLFEAVQHGDDTAESRDMSLREFEIRALSS